MKIGRDLISRVTDGVMDDVRDWAKRPLEDIYPIVFLDCMVIKVRESGSVQRRALYLALGVTLDGDRDVLGMWFQETERAKFWMQPTPEIRGTRDRLRGVELRVPAFAKKQRARPMPSRRATAGVGVGLAGGEMQGIGGHEPGSCIRLAAGTAPTGTRRQAECRI